MTVPELRELAQQVMNTSFERLRETGELGQMFFLLKPAGGMEIIVLDGSVTNNEEAKKKLGRELKLRVVAEQIQAVLMVSDVFVSGDMSKEQNRARRILGLTVHQAAQAGFCTVSEAVVVMVETPIYRLHLTQRYRRDGKRIQTDGEMVSHETPDVRALPSRFTGFFSSTDSSAGPRS